MLYCFDSRAFFPVEQIFHRLSEFLSFMQVMCVESLLRQLLRTVRVVVLDLPVPCPMANVLAAACWVYSYMRIGVNWKLSCMRAPGVSTLASS